MSNQIIISLDPGVTGAIATMWADGKIEVQDLPVVMTDNFNGIDPHGLDNIVKSIIKRTDGPENIVVYCERSILSPGNGKMTTRSIYDCRGVIRAVLALNNVPLIYVPPQTWKKFHGIPPKSDKEYSRGLALQIRPDLADFLARKKDHNRAEAVLLALYGANQAKTKGIYPMPVPDVFGSEIAARRGTNGPIRVTALIGPTNPVSVR